MDSMDAVVLSGDGLELRLLIGEYERPGVSGSDGAWVRGGVELTLTGPLASSFHSRLPVSWTDSELRAFQRALTTLLADLTGKASLSTLEDQIELRIELSSGRGTLQGRIEEHALARIEFEDVPTDQSLLTPALRSLRQATARLRKRGA